jgi:hypothetical protein
MFQRRFGTRFDRRLLLATPLVAGASWWAQRASGQETALTEGDCEDEPSVALLFAWRAGQPIYNSPADGAPQADWVPFEHPSLPVPYLIPPGWTGIPAWADSFTRSGMPEWQDAPLQLPQLTLARVVSPDGDAVFEYAVGSIQQVLLTTMQSAFIAKQSVLGENPDLNQVCAIDDQANPLSPAWFSVDRAASDLLITYGNALQLPHDIAPATVVTFTSLFAPRRQMPDLMYEVFFRILFQFLGGPSSDGGDEVDESDDADDTTDDAEDEEDDDGSD